MARKLVADGASSFYRVLVDPRDGAPLENGRTSYRLTKPMKRTLQLRDGKCTFPGCSNPSLDNEADHLKAWHHGGTTGISNLAQLCLKHHHLKHTTGWTQTPATKDHPSGWTSPTGRHYKAEHHEMRVCTDINLALASASAGRSSAQRRGFHPHRILPRRRRLCTVPARLRRISRRRRRRRRRGWVN